VSDKSAIEWLDGGSTWNPVRGCTPCAPECVNCYARAFAERWRGIPGHPYEQGFDVRLVPEALDLPRRWRKPRTVFVNSMSDLFHPAVPDRFIMDVVVRMSASDHHSYVLLTKRGSRMRDFFRAHREWYGEPPSHVTIGVSVGTRARLGEIDVLREIPAARRMVSFEPLLEDLGDVDLRGIDLVAIGGESGHGARPCDPGWIRSLVARCRAGGTAPFVKQLGAVWARAQGNPGYADPKGAEPDRWPADLRVREFPRRTP
jgi:protein gp37